MLKDILIHMGDAGDLGLSELAFDGISLFSDDRSVPILLKDEHQYLRGGIVFGHRRNLCKNGLQLIIREISYVVCLLNHCLDLIYYRCGAPCTLKISTKPVVSSISRTTSLTPVSLTGSVGNAF